MNAGTAADLVILVGAVIAGYGGYKMGLLRRVSSWIGLAVGLVIALRLLNPAVARLEHSAPWVRVVAVVAIVMGLTLIGQALGLLVGNALNAKAEMSPRRQRTDKLAGATAAVIAVFVGVWLLIPVLASAPGWPARMARESAAIAMVDRWTPDAPDALATLAREIAESPFPTVFNEMAESPDAGSPPTSGLPDAVDARARAATVMIEGQACDRIQDGSGFAVGGGLVVTNAHVVAGEKTTTVIDARGDSYKATVVAFDPASDLAVLRLRDFRADPLALADGHVGDVGAVYGHPGGGKLRAAPTRVAEQIVAVGRDIYGRDDVRRNVYVLAADLAPGDSGGALVNEQGEVIGVAFAIDPGRATTAYALTASEVRSVLDAVSNGTARTDTGACLVG